MNQDLYPRESERMDIIAHLDELRRRILTYLIFLFAATCLLFAKGNLILAFLEAPARQSIGQFIAITPTEVFATYFKVVLLGAFIVSFPVLLYEFWMFLAPALNENIRRMTVIWFLFALLFFFGGLIFTYTVLLPSAINFLLNFGRGLATPMISIDKYFSFAAAIMLVGGCVFEIPIVIGILTEVGIMNTKKLCAGRKAAILINIIIAAIITPTQDVFNLLLFAVPMVLLYEIGIIFSLYIEKRRRNYVVCE